MKNPFENIPTTAAERQDDPVRHVPEAEYSIEFARSSGPGGQKVNKTSSKAVLRWNIEASSSFTPEEKAVINEKLANRINKAGELYLDSDRLRSQYQNRMDVTDLLDRLVSEALKPQVERIATRPTASSKERRLEEKKRQARKKEARKGWD